MADDEKKPTSIATNQEDTAELFEKAADNLLEAFLFLDRNKDTRIQTEELAPLLCKVGFGDVGGEGVQQIIEIFDDNGDGEMDLLEFCEFFSYIFKTLVKRRPKSSYLKYLDE